MAYSFLIFDFGGNEDAAQQARHKIDGWKQGFRLDKKMQVKFDRKETEAIPDPPSNPPKKPAKDASKSKLKSKSDGDVDKKAASGSEPVTDIRLIVRLDFSDHEKLSHQRWLDRIPIEEPFKSVKAKILRSTDPDFGETSDLFDSLDKHSGARPRE